MALAVRFWCLFPVGRSAAWGLRLPAGAAGSRGQRVPWRLGASEAMGNSGTFKRSLLFSALSYLGFETYQVISQAVLVHAAAKVFEIEEVLEQADYLYESGETEKLYQLLTQYKESEDAELLWRLARASRDVAQLSGTSEEEKKFLVYEALEYAKRALEKNESSCAAHKKAIELNPKDATSIHLMGIWCYTVAEMPWYQRRIAKVLFATPPGSTYEEALGYFHRAEQVDPNFYSKNLLLLGKTYLKLHNKKLAAFWLTKAKDYPAHTEEDKQVQHLQNKANRFPLRHVKERYRQKLLSYLEVSVTRTENFSVKYLRSIAFSSDFKDNKYINYNCSMTVLLTL
ncbi:regulator of microtubule dynamics protein 1 isoform X2 [Bos indicus x Bos taurus]|uniref:regulator of microtubule dynamics protein 1 isoform X2 n=1 Tax=Bos indicus x Bos taurus TaxID=30522 RepID=UPI000572E1A1|nr:regulator of microtubule dynamics protein 1 isoform X2 [Bos indicus x Bos taurus]